MKETPFVVRLLQKLRRIPFTWWVKTIRTGSNGTPDIIGCVRCEHCGDAKMACIEAKTETGQPTALQLHTIKQLHAAGAFARVVRPSGADELMEALHRLRFGTPWFDDDREQTEPEQD